MVRVRYAPSPTGHLHIGNARTALFNYLFARSKGGKFIVRIEDTDVERNVAGGEESQLANLKWLGVDWDESVDKPGEYGPYRQLERLDIYKKYTDLLLEQGLAYKCYCTKEELEEEREELLAKGEDKIHYSRKCYHNNEEKDLPYTIRFLVPENKDYTFNDIVKGSVTFNSADIGDWVIVKQNGIPTYNFACAIDDHLMAISHVLRGEDHITNTPKQMMIYEAFDWDIPTFGHMTLIVNEAGKKLSKRDESILQFISQYKDLGYLSDALFNFISLLGWSPKGEEEILSHDELVASFDESRLSKSPAKFDKEKLTYINNRYVKELSEEASLELFKPFLDDAFITGDFTSIVSLFKERCSYGKEMVDVYNEFFGSEFVLNDDALVLLHTEGVKETLEVFKNLLTNLDEFTPEQIKATIKQTGKDSGAKGKMLFMPCRVATTGMMHGPDLPQVLAILGKEKVIERLILSISK